MTTGDNQLRGWTEMIQRTSLTQTCTNKGHDHCLAVCCLIHYNFLNPSQTITSEKYAQQINEMHQKQQCPQPALVKRKGLILLYNAQLHIAQPMLQKLTKLGYKVLRHLYSPDFFSPTTTTSSTILINTFLQRKCFHSRQEAENAF